MPREMDLPPVYPPDLSPGGEWVDELLLRGPDNEVCLWLGLPVDRVTLRSLVADRQRQLKSAGITGESTVALRLPPSLCYVTVLLAAWRIGAQVALLDYRLTQHEIDQALEHLAPQLVVESTTYAGGPLRAFFDVDASLVPFLGRPERTGHALIQLSSGSTGPSKIIGRTAANVIAELDRYNRIDGIPRRGERAVVLASMVHVLGLVGGLLHSLNAGVRMVVPERLTIDRILRALAEGTEPTTLIGVPSQAEILAAVAEPPDIPQFIRMVTGGEPVRPELWRTLTDGYGITLGNMYGMTEMGVIATDIAGEHRPALAPAPGVRVRVDNGEVLLGMADSPYVGLVDPTRWTNGWLRTRDAGDVDLITGFVTIRGRLDSQVSIGGLKVDLTEVEQTIAAVPGVDAAVIVYEEGIKAYVTVSAPVDAAEINTWLRSRLAAYKRPRVVHVLPAIPRTSSGKLVRNPAALRAASEQAVAET